MTKQRAIENCIGGVLIVGALLCIFTPPVPLFQRWAHFAMQITLIYWLLGILLLTRRSARLAIVTFCSCALLCIYLKGATSFPAAAGSKTASGPTLKVLHFNVNAGKGGYSDALRSIARVEPDVVSLQEISPDWDRAFRDSLGSVYKYSCKSLGADLYGVAIYSKYPLLDCDTFYCDHVPNIAVSVRGPLNTPKIFLVASYIAPPLYSSARQVLKRQLGSISEYINKLQCPTLAFGDYNIEAFSPEIIQFKNMTRLQDSRRGYRPIRDDGSISFTEVPKDFIFFNNQMKCIDFKTVCDAQSERLGIMGTYQINADSLILLAKGFQ